MKGKDDGCLLIGLVNKKYVPFIDLNSEEFKHQGHQSSFEYKNGVLLGMKKKQTLA